MKSFLANGNFSRKKKRVLSNQVGIKPQVLVNATRFRYSPEEEVVSNCAFFVR